jgi:hypothetical protein
VSNIAIARKFLSDSYVQVVANRVINIFRIAGQKAVTQSIDDVNSMSAKITDSDLMDSILASCFSSNIISKPECRLESNNNNEEDYYR